jgi:hypothetical protein
MGTDQKVKKRQAMARMIALIFLVLMLLSLGARIRATVLLIDAGGPTHMAASATKVYVHSNNSIIELSNSGQWVKQHLPGQTHLDGDLIDLRVLTDGRLLLAEQQPARIRLCNPENWSCTNYGDKGLEGIARQLKVLPVGTGESGSGPVSLLVTDSRGDSLWRIAEHQSPPVSMLEPGALAGPNDLAFDADGRLWIADTDYRRITEWVLAEDGGFEQGRQHSAVNDLTRDGRYYPIMLAADTEGRWWVTQAGENSEGNADVVIYDPNKGAVAQVEIPGAVFPTDLVLSGNHMLVSDLESFTVYAVDVSQLEVRTFGDERFIAIMNEQRREQRKLTLFTQASLGAVLVFAVLMIGAAIMATPAGKRFTKPPAAIDLTSDRDRTPEVRGVHWLVKSPVQIRALKALNAMMIIVPLLVVSGGVVLFALIRMPDGRVLTEGIGDQYLVIILIVLFNALVLVGLLYLLHTLRNTLKRRLGSDGKRVWIGLEDGSTLKVLPEDLRHNGRVIYYRQYTLALMTGKGQEVYQPTEVAQWITPLLRDSEQYGPMQSLAHQWRYKDPQLLAVLAFVIVLGLATAALAIWQHWPV